MLKIFCAKLGLFTYSLIFGIRKRDYNVEADLGSYGCLLISRLHSKFEHLSSSTLYKICYNKMVKLKNLLG